LVPLSVKGFTLVELLIVLALTAILAGLAVPRYANSVARYRAEMAARRIAADLALAGSQARQIGKPVIVTFNIASSTYTLSGVEGLRHLSNNYCVDLSVEPYRASVSSASFSSGTLSSAGAQVTFSIYGTPNAGGQVVVRCGSYSKTAVLDQASGRASIQ
jgi:prepilin-type N-terminal cleavage/methylation domain-containing protein